MARILPIAIVGLALVLYALWRGAYPDLFEDTEPPPPAETMTAPATPPSERAPAESGAPASAPVAAPDTPTAKPELDVVRIDEDGDTVIAGKAAPGASVTVATQDGPLATVKADERGNWVALPEKPLPAGDHAVTIESTAEDGKTEAGDKTIVVSIPEEKGGKPLVVAVPTRDFGASEVLQRPEIPPVADEPAGIEREPPAESPASPEKPAVLAAAPKEGPQTASPAARSKPQGTAAADGRATQDGATGEPARAGEDARKEAETPTAAKAPVSGERAVPPAGAATQPAQQQAAASGEPSPEDKAGDEARPVAAAPGKEQAKAPAAVAATSPDKAPPSRSAAPEKEQAEDRPAPVADARATPTRTIAAAPDATAEAPEAPEKERAEDRPAPVADAHAAPTGTTAAAPDATAEAPEAPEKERAEDRPAPVADASAAPTGTTAEAPEKEQAEDRPAPVADARATPTATAPPAPAAATTAEAPAAPEEEQAEDRPAPVADASAAPTATAPPAPAATAGAPAEPEEGQAAAGAPPKAGGVSVDSVDYDDRGNLALSGTAKPGSVVEPKIAGLEPGSESLGETKADETGAWRLKVERPVAPGRYRLTVEERSPEGAPRSRISLPFERADPIADFPPGDIVVVQPGNSLWRIARRLYGQGVRYTVIYAANRAQIGNPDLIFPGQIFSVPQGAPPARAPG